MTLALTLVIAFTSALPTPASTPSIFRFPINTPKMDTLWLVDSLPQVSWDITEMPKDSTMDIALLHHAKKQSILLRRYGPSSKSNLVLRAPYTVGWTIPKPLEGAKSRVNILLVSRDAREGDKTVRVLATNIDAQVGFMYVFLPDDVPLKAYHIKIEIVGKGRKFSGYTHKFFTSLPAFSSRA
ncbi:hypothetical protein BGZ92_008380 [Podila epicladia]|nr:hypothetical protein BGZ92_008380 [Podila epicladia]